MKQCAKFAIPSRSSSGRKFEILSEVINIKLWIVSVVDLLKIQIAVFTVEISRGVSIEKSKLETV